MLKAVIFDLDGTLVNTLEDLCDSTNYALEKYGFEKRELSKFNKLVGSGVLNLIEQAISTRPFTEEEKQTVFNCFMTHYRGNFLTKSLPYEGMYECVKTLKENGVKLAVVSNKIDEMTQKIVNELFSGEFSEVFGKVEEYPIKPDPTLTLEVIKRLGVKPCETAFVGDSEVDIKTAKNAGCVSIGVSWGFRSEQEVLSENPDYFIHNTSEIAPIVLGCNND